MGIWQIQGAGDAGQDDGGTDAPGRPESDLVRSHQKRFSGRFWRCMRLEVFDTCAPCRDDMDADGDGAVDFQVGFSLFLLRFSIGNAEIAPFFVHFTKR